MATVFALEAGEAPFEKATIQIAVDGRLDTAAQVAVRRLEAFFVHLQELAEMMGQSAVQDALLGPSAPIDARLCGLRHPGSSTRRTERQAQL